MAIRRTEDRLDKLNTRVQDMLLKKDLRLGIDYLDHQLEIARCPARHKIIAKGRRWGGTVFAMRESIWEAWQYGWNNLWVDTAYGQMLEYVARYAKPMLRPLPRSLWKWNQQTTKLSFAGGGSIKFGSMDRPDLLEGLGYNRITINEAGHVLKRENLYYETLLPMGAEYGGAYWTLVGTPKAGSPLYHRLFLKGVEGGEDFEPGWASFQRPSHENPLLNRAVLEQWRVAMPQRVYRREVLAEFILEGGEFFTDLEGFAIGAVEPQRDPAGAYVLGVDLAKTIDWTVVWIGRVLGGNVLDPQLQRRGIACQRWQKLPWPETWRRIKELAADYGNPPIYLDATGLGSTVVDELRSDGLRVEGIVMSNKLKSELCYTLAADIEHRRLSVYPHLQTLSELRSFESKMKEGTNTISLGAPKGEYDDCVIALALMNWGMGRPSNFNMVMTRPSLMDHEDFPSLIN